MVRAAAKRSKDGPQTRRLLALAAIYEGATRIEAPVVDLLRLDAPAVQLVDPRTGAGKSAIAAAAGSFWGGRDIGTFAESWSHTPGFFELLAATHHAAFVVLDDLRTFQFKKHGFEGFDEVLMCFANGAGKGRLTDIGPIAEWRTPLLSTSNNTLDQMAARYGYPVDDALRMRLIDVPLPFGADGAFEELHGFDSHGAFGTRLRQLAARARGAAAVLFISRIQTLRMRDEAEVRRFVIRARIRYTRAARARHLAGDRDLTRLIDRFSTIYAAGVLAIRTRVVTWTPDDLLEAVLACADAHLALGIPEAGAALGFAPPVSPLDRLREHVRANNHFFVDIRHGKVVADGKHDHDRCPGYLSELDSEPEYFFSEAMWRDVCGGRGGAALAKTKLRESGMLNDTGARPSTRRVVRVGSEKRREQGIAVKTAFSSAPIAKS
jgi:hypothetical protein